MKISLYIIAILSGVFFVMKVIQLQDQDSIPYSESLGAPIQDTIDSAEYEEEVLIIEQQAEIPEFMMHDAAPGNSDYDKLSRKMEAQIQRYTAGLEMNDSWNFWVNLAVVLLIGTSTVLSTIQGVRKKAANNASNRKYLVICAILTCLSGAGNFLAGHFNEEKTEYAKLEAHYRGEQDRFFDEYDKADPIEQIILIKKYNRRFRDAS